MFAVERGAFVLKHAPNDLDALFELVQARSDPREIITMRDGFWLVPAATDSECEAALAHGLGRHR